MHICTRNILAGDDDCRQGMYMIEDLARWPLEAAFNVLVASDRFPLHYDPTLQRASSLACAGVLVLGQFPHPDMQPGAPAGDISDSAPQESTSHLPRHAEAVIIAITGNSHTTRESYVS